MSRKHGNTYGFEFPNLYIFLILVLIVLQWFRVGCTGGEPGAQAPESNLINNGGLFIITLFLLVACACGGGMTAGPQSCRHHHKHHKHQRCKCC